MINFKVLQSGVYRTPEKHIQKTESYWIGLYVSGQIRQRLWLPDGRLLDDFTGDSGPCLFWRVPGMRIEFEYGTDRENWVVMLETESMSYAAGSRMLQLRYGDYQLSVPFSIKISPAEIPALRNQFDLIHQAWQRGLPRDRLYAALLVGGLFGRLVQPVDDTAAELSPARKLKQLIDADDGFKYNLSELSEQAGYSRDYLRLNFEHEFHLTPGEYREHRRLYRIMELIANSSLTPSEIASRVSLKHVSHLNILLRRHYQLTPTELIRRNRFRSPA